eukprot:748342-Pelagomonas_calceolata.AAC.1
MAANGPSKGRKSKGVMASMRACMDQQRQEFRRREGEEECLDAPANKRFLAVLQMRYMYWRQDLLSISPFPPGGHSAINPVLILKRKCAGSKDMEIGSNSDAKAHAPIPAWQAAEHMLVDQHSSPA